eukprot:7092163-Pyramimonas_sp.AAC.1
MAVGGLAPANPNALAELLAQLERVRPRLLPHDCLCEWNHWPVILSFILELERRDSSARGDPEPVHEPCSMPNKPLDERELGR